MGLEAQWKEKSLLKKAHGKYSSTCPLPFSTFQVLNLFIATNPF